MAVKCQPVLPGRAWRSSAFAEDVLDRMSFAYPESGRPVGWLALVSGKDDPGARVGPGPRRWGRGRRPAWRDHRIGTDGVEARRHASGIATMIRRPFPTDRLAGRTVAWGSLGAVPPLDRPRGSGPGMGILVLEWVFRSRRVVVHEPPGRRTRQGGRSSWSSPPWAAATLEPPMGPTRPHHTVLAEAGRAILAAFCRPIPLPPTTSRACLRKTMGRLPRKRFAAPMCSGTASPGRLPGMGRFPGAIALPRPRPARSVSMFASSRPLKRPRPEIRPRRLPGRRPQGQRCAPTAAWPLCGPAPKDREGSRRIATAASGIEAFFGGHVRDRMGDGHGIGHRLAKPCHRSELPRRHGQKKVSGSGHPGPPVPQGAANAPHTASGPTGRNRLLRNHRQAPSLPRPCPWVGALAGWIVKTCCHRASRPSRESGITATGGCPANRGVPSGSTTMPHPRPGLPATGHSSAGGSWRWRR